MTVPEIDVAELARRRAEGAYLLDVRQPDEYHEFHVPGAVLIPLGELPERMGEIPTGQPVHVICKSGGRSARAVEHLNANGYAATNVAGGSDGWREAGYEVATGSEAG